MRTIKINDEHYIALKAINKARNSVGKKEIFEETILILIDQMIYDYGNDMDNRESYEEKEVYAKELARLTKKLKK